MSSYAELVGKQKLAEQVADDPGNEMTPAELQSDVSAATWPYAEALSDEVADLETPGGRTNALVQASVVDNALSRTAR